MIFKKLWQRYVHSFDDHFLGNAIDKVAEEHNAPQEYKDLAWGIHKVLDPNYEVGDLTPGELDAVDKFMRKVEG